MGAAVVVVVVPTLTVAVQVKTFLPVQVTTTTQRWFQFD
jgi:hypothetical protein